MGNVLTVYNCGTAFDESRTDELVAWLAKRHSSKGKRYDDWIITAGPGSPGIQDPHYDPIHQRQYKIKKSNGELKYFVSTSDNKWADIDENGVWDKARQALVTQGEGLIAGSGMDLNAAMLIQLLNEKKRAGKSIHTVNMIGWSRGAITCILMANELSLYFPHIKVNIFAIDPVPGPGNFKDSRLRKIPENVRNITVIQMENENRYIMSLQHLNFSVARRFVGQRILNFPGVHDTAVMRTHGERHLKAVHEVVADLAGEFLEDFGSGKIYDPPMGLSQVCEKFSIMLLDTEKFMKMGKPPYRQKGGSSAWVPLQDHFNSSNPYFINPYHEFCFKCSWPKVYQVLFQNPRLPFPKSLFNFQGQPFYNLLNSNGLLPHTKESLLKWPQIYSAAAKKPFNSVLPVPISTGGSFN